MAILQNYAYDASNTQDAGLRDYMVRVYGMMSLGIAVTAGAALAVFATPGLANLLLGTPLLYVCILGLFVLTWALGSKTQAALKNSEVSSAPTLTVLFLSYAGLMGVLTSSVLIMYTTESVARCFFITASMFGAMSLYGYTTKKDLSSMGSLFFMGLLGVMIASIVNIFMQSSTLSWALSILSVVIFTGLTAYDTQNIRNLYTQARSQNAANSLAVFGASILYTDFINLFLNMMRLLGDRKDR